ncbi:hypothetical protein ACFQ08_20295, partial [Streptosporangium algeriense]
MGMISGNATPQVAPRAGQGETIAVRPNRPAPSWKLSRRLLRLAFNVAEHIGPSLASMHWHVPREAYAPPVEACDRCPSPPGP